VAFSNAHYNTFEIKIKKTGKNYILTYRVSFSLKRARLTLEFSDEIPKCDNMIKIVIKAIKYSSTPLW